MNFDWNQVVWMLGALAALTGIILFIGIPITKSNRKSLLKESRKTHNIGDLVAEMEAMIETPLMSVDKIKAAKAKVIKEILEWRSERIRMKDA